MPTLSELAGFGAGTSPLGLLSGAVDERTRYYANIVRGLLDNPAALVDQLRAQNAENVRERSHGVQDTRSVMPQVADPAKQAAFDEAMNVAFVGNTTIKNSMKIAQKNAAKPISKGGLGLPKNNTAQDRAKALGYTTRGYRGTTSDEIVPNGPVWWTEDPSYANAYGARIVKFSNPTLEAKVQPNVMPLLVNAGNKKRFEKYNIGGVPDTKDIFNSFSNGITTGYRSDTTSEFFEALTVPENVRSIFAAFDPAKIGAKDWLATIATLGLIGGAANGYDSEY